VLKVHEPLHVMLQVGVSGTVSARIREGLQTRCYGAPLEVTEVSIPARAVHVTGLRPGTRAVASGTEIPSEASHALGPCRSPSRS
jgi:hypothetical protein